MKEAVALRAVRPLLERWLDGPERVALWIPWSANARILVRGVFGFLKQIARSRALAGRVHEPTPRVVC